MKQRRGEVVSSKSLEWGRKLCLMHMAAEGGGQKGTEQHPTWSLGISLNLKRKLSRRWAFRAPTGLDRSLKEDALLKSSFGLE